MIRRALGDDRGSVVAEFAVALPAIALVVLFGTGALTASSHQVRLQDAAADAARLAARGETDARVRATVTSAVPGAAVAVTERGDIVCVTASAPTALPFVSAAAEGCALAGGL